MAAAMKKSKKLVVMKKVTVFRIACWAMQRTTHPGAPTVVSFFTSVGLPLDLYTIDDHRAPSCLRSCRVSNPCLGHKCSEVDAPGRLVLCLVREASRILVEVGMKAKKVSVMKTSMKKKISKASSSAVKDTWVKGLKALWKRKGSKKGGKSHPLKTKASLKHTTSEDENGDGEKTSEKEGGGKKTSGKECAMVPIGSQGLGRGAQAGTGSIALTMKQGEDDNNAFASLSLEDQKFECRLRSARE